MLILTRRIGEAITIGENAEVKITVLDAKGSHIRLGISAPREIQVHREEIFNKILSERDTSETHVD